MKKVLDQNWRELLEPILRKSGDIILSYWGQKLSLTIKEKGFATDADLASEEYLTKALVALLPDAGVWAEENGKSGSDSAEYHWVIDPLDGTTNFAHGIPYFCISVALTYHGEPIVAAIYNPTQDEFYFAQKGEGSWLNGKKITVSSPKKLSHALIAAGLPYGAKKKSNALETVQEVVQHVFAIRHYGAAALDLAQVAAGRFDGLLFIGLGWWDVAAGMLLVQEAGGIVSDFTGDPVDAEYPNCIAGGPLVYEGVRDIVKNSPDGK